MQRTLTIMSHNVYLTIKSNGHFLTDMATGKNVSPREAGLTTENGGFLWLGKVASDTQKGIVRSSQLWYNPETPGHACRQIP
jgi:hypothetical protein